MGAAAWGLLALVAAAAGALPWVLSPRARARRRWRQVHHQLAAANGLDADQERLLWRIGVGAGLDNPAQVFVRPVLFASRAAQAGLDPAATARIQQQIYGR